MIAAPGHVLGPAFPASYREFLREFGCDAGVRVPLATTARRRKRADTGADPLARSKG